MEKSKRKKYLREKLFLRTKLDISFLLAVLFINVFGIVMIYSASYYYAESAYGYAPDHFFKNQLMYVAIGFVAMIIVSFIRPSVYKRLMWFALAGVFLFMIAVRIPSCGIASHGAYRWVGLKIGSRQLFRLQIAEPVKILLIIFPAGFMVRYPVTKWKSLLVLGATALLSGILLLFLSNNMSTALIVFLMMYGMVVVAHPKPKYFLFAAIAVVLIAVIALIIFDKTPFREGENFRFTRIRAWLHPTAPEYASDTAYQPTQALYAIASGKFFGKGLGQSLIKFKLPEPHNDYILAIIFEELGIFGVLILTYLFLYLFYKIFRVFAESKDKFSKYLVMGVFFHLTLQTVLNYMVTLGLLPTMGVTLPFISAGGSSAAFALLELGIVMSVARQTEETRIYEEATEEKYKEDPYYYQLVKEKDARKQRK